MLYLHLGLAKTGTTFLQREVLPHIRHADYLGKPQTNLIEGANPWDGALRNFFDLSPAVWDELGERLFQQMFGPSERKRDRPSFLSDENACVNFFHKRDYLASQRALRGHDPHTVRDHLKKFISLADVWGFEQVKLLVSVRRQDQWLASSYAQTSNRRPDASQHDFERFLRELLSTTSDYYLNGISLDYALLLRLLAEAAGKENVLMLPYELMKDDLPSFLETWSQFMGLSEEESLASVCGKPSTLQTRNVRSASESTWAIRERREFNTKVLRLRPSRLFSSLGLPIRLPLRPPEFGRGREIRLTEELRRTVLERYESSNRSLAEEIGLDLSTYGYYGNSKS